MKKMSKEELLRQIKITELMENFLKDIDGIPPEEVLEAVNNFLIYIIYCVTDEGDIEKALKVYELLYNGGVDNIKENFSKKDKGVH